MKTATQTQPNLRWTLSAPPSVSADQTAGATAWPPAASPVATPSQHTKHGTEQHPSLQSSQSTQHRRKIKHA